MTPEEFIAVVKGTTYKPGWTFEIYEDRFKCVVTVVLCGNGLPNSCDPSRTTDIIKEQWFTYALLNSLDQAGARYALAQMISELERHEMDEWLRFGGVRHREPHPELALLVAERREEPEGLDG